jgi:hypothetical protein
MEGYIKLHRQILDSGVFASAYGLKVWIWCLCKAGYKDRFVPVKTGIGETIVKLNVGSFIFGRYKAEDEIGIDGSTIYKWIKKLELMEMITISSNTHYSIITICNWDTYQTNENNEEQPKNNQVTTKEQPSNTNKKVKKVKNSKEYIIDDWKTSFSIYKEELTKAYKKLINDEDYINQRQGYHKNLNIHKSLEKACVDYWATEDGWAKKKKLKNKTINWKTTFNNALSMKCNQVYKD